MSFSKKIIWSITLSIAFIFSLGASLLIIQNHHHMLNSAQQQNITTHRSSTFSLESKLIQDTVSINTSFGSEESAMRNRALYYVSQLQKQVDSDQILYRLYDEEGTLLYSEGNEEANDSYQIDTQRYQRTWIHGDPVFLISSTIQAGSTKFTFMSCYDLSSIYQERTRQFQTFLWIDGCMLLISYLIVRMLSAYLTKPIQTLNDISKEIAQGNYHIRTNLEGSDEIGQLSKSFDEMAEMNETTIHALKQNLEDMEAFMGSFSHEIKTPMTAIIGFADMLRSYQCDSETIHSSAQFIFTEGKRLEDLSYQLMELLSLSSTQVEKTAISTHSLLTQLQEYYHSSSNNIIFQMEPCLVVGNETLLFTLARNLIDNGCKASKRQEPLYVYGSLQEQRYVIEVKDQGIGMSPEQVLQATKPFYMADPSRKREHGGAGLGLAICQRICEAHQSELSITSQPCMGTSVKFSLEVVQ